MQFTSGSPLSLSKLISLKQEQSVEQLETLEHEWNAKLFFHKGDSASELVTPWGIESTTTFLFEND